MPDPEPEASQPDIDHLVDPPEKDASRFPHPSSEGTLEWPPPDPSAIAEIEARYFAGDRTLWDAAERIRGMLVRRGYQDLGWYRTGTGFAVATRCERIDDSGIPLGEPRFSTTIPRFHDFSLRGIARALFSAPRGRFRVIVIAVTSDPGAVHRRTGTTDATAVEALSAGGNAPIPRTLDQVSLARHAALILFYEIAKLGDASPRIVTDGLTSADHVRGSGLETW